MQQNSLLETVFTRKNTTTLVQIWEPMSK